MIIMIPLQFRGKRFKPVIIIGQRNEQIIQNGSLTYERCSVSLKIKEVQI